MLIPAIIDFFKYKVVGSIIVLTCDWSTNDAVKFTKQLSKYGASSTVSCDPGILGRVSHHQLQGVLYVDEHDRDLMEKVHPEYFSVRYKWLIVAVNLPNLGKLRYDADMAWIKSNEDSELVRPFRLDAKALTNQAEPISIQDIYIHPRDGVSTHAWAVWTPGPGLQLLKERERILRRQNLAKYPLKVASPVGMYSKDWFNGTFGDYLRNEALPERDSGVRTGYRAASLIFEMLNATEILLQTTLWATLDDNTSVIRMVSSDKAQLAGAHLRMIPKRLNYVDYVMPIWPFSVGFTYIAERESSSNMYVEPFSAGVWWCCLGLGLVLAFAQRVTARLPQEREAAYISVLATWLQQGASAIPQNLSARWSFICLSVASMLVYAYYTSAIVSALVGTGVGGPTTLKALADSRYAIVSDSYEYMNYTFFGVNTGWDELEYLKKKKMTSSNFYQDMVMGVRLILEGRTAYHAEYNAIYPHLRSFSDEHACKLQFIDTVPENPSWIVMMKHSEWSNVFKTKGAWMQETGIAPVIVKSELVEVVGLVAHPTNPSWIVMMKHSEWSNVFKTKGAWMQETGIAPVIVSRFLIKPPPCRASLLAERVKFGDVAPLLSLTALGACISLIVLAVEIMVARSRMKKEGVLEGMEPLEYVE